MEVPGKLATKGQNPCDLCKRQGKQNYADGFCSDCYEYMCIHCFQVHLLTKPCRNHVLGSLDRSRRITLSYVKSEYCKTHKTETIRYYCHTHCSVACGDCVVASHSECKMSIISDLARNFENSSEFLDILLKIKTLQSEVNESRILCKKDRLEKNSVLDIALSDIRRFRKELNDFLDNAEKEIINEAKILKEKNENSFAEIEQNIADLMNKISQLNKELDPKSFKDVALFIRFTERKSNVNDIEQRLSAIKSRNTSPTITFAPDQTLKKILNSTPKFGYLETESPERFRKELATASKYSTQIENTETKRVTKTWSTTPKYLPPDPRAHGFDVGTKVKRTTGLSMLRGVVTKVYPEGYVDVRDDKGCTVTHLHAGANGKFDMYLDNMYKTIA